MALPHPLSDPDKVEPTTFRVDRLSRLSEIEAWHFWFAGRRTLLEEILAVYVTNNTPHLVDLGCGTGFTLASLQRPGWRLSGFELRPEGLSRALALYPQLYLGRASVEALPLASDCCDIVLLLDVLEHVDDQAALQEAWRILRLQGLLIISVPAMPWLWSFRDVDAGHRRRYTRRTLTRLCTTVNATLLELAYFQFALFPLVAAARLFGRRGPSLRDFEEQRLPVLNSLFTRINQLEARLTRHVSWPWGSSLVAVLRK